MVPATSTAAVGHSGAAPGLEEVLEWMWFYSSRCGDTGIVANTGMLL